MLALNTNQSIHINKQYFISGIVQLVSYKLYQCFQQKMNVKYVVGNCRFKYDSSLTKKHFIIKKTLFLSSYCLHISQCIYCLRGTQCLHIFIFHTPPGRTYCQCFCCLRNTLLSPRQRSCEGI